MATSNNKNKSNLLGGDVDESGNNNRTILRTLSANSSNSTLSISMNQIHSTGGSDGRKKTVIDAGGSLKTSTDMSNASVPSPSQQQQQQQGNNNSNGGKQGTNLVTQSLSRASGATFNSSSPQQSSPGQDLSRTLLGEIQFLERLLQDLITQRNTNTRKATSSADLELAQREGESDGDEGEWRRYEDQLKSIIESKKADFRTLIMESDKTKPVQKKSAFLKSGAALSIFPTVMEEKLCSALPLIYIDSPKLKDRTPSTNNILFGSSALVNNNSQNNNNNNNNNNGIQLVVPSGDNIIQNNNNNSQNSTNGNQSLISDTSSGSSAEQTELSTSTSRSSSSSSLSSLALPAKPYHTVVGPRADMPEDQLGYNNTVYCKSGSSYPKHFSGRRQGDPICDRFKVSIYRDKVIATLADGCNWGRLPYEAAQKATDSFLAFMEEHHHQINTIRKAGSFLLAAMTAAHKGIIAGKGDWESGTTTLIGGLLTKIKKERDNNAILKRMSSLSFVEVDNDWVFIGTSLGDCKAFHYSKKNNIFTDITKGNRTNVSDARDPGGRLGPYVGNGEPDLRNLSVFYKYCDEGDLILLLSDGVHDNLDPQQLGVKPTDLGLDTETWDQAGAKSPADTDRIKNDFRTKWLNERFNTEEHTTPEYVTEQLIKHCMTTTQTSRDFMEENPAKKLPCDYYLYPGKMDHNTCVCFRVGLNTSLQQPESPSIPRSEPVEAQSP